MPKGYVIMTEAIRDEAAMGAYGQASFPTVQQHGGSVIIAYDDPEILEGSWHGTRTVVIKFDSVSAAHGWYRSAEYQAARAIREDAAEVNVVIVGGFEMPTG